MAKSETHTGAWLLGLAGAVGVGFILGTEITGKALASGVRQGRLAVTPEGSWKEVEPGDVTSANERGQYGR